MSSPSTSPAYLYHLNGLRAVAILAVLLYHLRAEYCPAGYFGVDLFLVISGYLLLRRLLKPGAAGEFHYGSYLLKKAWRIIPPWFAITVAVLVVSFYLLPADRLGNIVKTARYSAFFRADHFIDKSGDYFNIYTQQNPLLHFWYLSITQQLYLLAPLLVIPLARWVSRKAAVLLLAVLALLSLVFYVLTTFRGLVPPELSEKLLKATSSTSAYYHLLPRFWEIAAGALLLLLPEWRERPVLRAVLGALGLLGIAASFWLFSTGSPAIYMTVICTVLALRYADSGPAGWLLGLRPVQALGTISFSLYLWHWPVMVFWKYWRLDAPGPWDEVGMVLLSLALGAFFWWGIEKRRMPSTAGWKRLSALCALLLGMMGAIIITGMVFKQYLRQTPTHAQLPNHEAPIPNPPAIEGALLQGLDQLPAHGMPLKPLLLGAPQAQPAFFFMGDSHAWHHYLALHEACEQEGISGVYLNNSTSPYWYREHPKQGGDTCTWNERIGECLLRWLEAQPNIRHVIITQSWSRRLMGDDGLDWRTGSPIAKGEASLQATSAGLRELCVRLNALGKQVILLGDTPMFKSPAPFDTWQRSQRQVSIVYQERYISQAEHDHQHRIPRDLFARLEAEGVACYLDPAPALMEEGRYPARIDGAFLYFDAEHLSLTGARRVAAYLLPRLKELLRGANE